MKQPRFQWTPEQTAMLQARYPHEATTALAQALGIDLAQVYSKASRLGLKKSAEFMSVTDNSGRIFRGGTLGQKTQFQAGQVSWNAGRKGWQAGGRSVVTQFTTGMVPPNTQPIGSLRIVTNHGDQRQLERKVCDTPGPNHMRWKSVHRLLWEAAYGPTPAGHIVIFKRGMKTLVLEEITLDKVECISRAENANRNHPNRSNPEVAKLIQLKAAITRQVNRIQAQTQTQESAS